MLEWRRVGNTVLDLSLASLAGGPFDRVWFSADGSRLYARTQAGGVWQTADFETWQPAAGLEAPGRSAPTVTGPDGSAGVIHPLAPTRAYSAGAFVFRSDDGGLNWSNVSANQRQSILGGKLNDVAVSPRNPDEVIVAGTHGVWRSMDSGDSWTGINEGFPTIPVSRILSATPSNIQVLSNGIEVEWTAGERSAWRPMLISQLAREQALRGFATTQTGAQITAAAAVEAVRYAGGVDGKLYFSRDSGANWGTSGMVAGTGRVERIAIDSQDANVAVAITGSRSRGRVLRTTTGGVFWEDLTGNLPAGILVRGAAFDRASNTTYVATERGVYFASTETSAAVAWTQLREGLASDVALDSNGNQLLAAFEEQGLFAVLAPHRLSDPRVVSAADRIERAAAPGSLLSVIGARVQTATIGDRNAPVLAATEVESQIQVPFDVAGNNLQLAAATTSGARRIGLTLLPVAPSIFVDKDGVPLVMNADTGLVLEPNAPARSGARLQILVTGLGKVQPEWPTGLAGPLENPPAVVTPVQAYLEREPLEVTRAVLAPGYIGMYLVEVKMPTLVNPGTAELYIEAQGQASNRVRIFLEP